MSQLRWMRFVTGSTVLLMVAPLGAQGTISGRVSAMLGNQPLADARVIVIGRNQSASTDEDGKYTLRNIAAGTVEVQVLRVGYESQKKAVTVAAGAAATLDFQLAVAVVHLQEVVTTATGQQRKVELGNAISTLGNVAQRVEDTQIKTFQDLLVAKAPGVIVLPNTVTGGAPTIRIRGLNSLSLSNAPIVVLDGVRMNSQSNSAGVGGTSYSMLNSLDPDEIEDVEIVKGPSAATLYGTDAANGVIVITTKKGRAGKPRWSWFAEQGAVDDRNDYPAMYANWGHAPGSTVAARCQLATMGPDTCISDSLTAYTLLKDKSSTFLHTGNRSQYGVQVSGGSEQIRYFIAGDLENETGPVRMPDFAVASLADRHIDVRDEWKYPERMQKENIRVNLNAALSPKLDLSVNTGFIKSDNRLPQSDNNILSLFSAGLQTNGFKHPGLDYTGVGTLGEPLNGYLPFSPSEIMQFVREQGIQRMIGSSTANWRPFTWMQNDGTVGVDLAARNDFQLCRLDECPAFGTNRQGRVSDNHTNDRFFTAKLSSTSTWNARTWANVKTTLGADYINTENDFSNASGTQLPAGFETVAAAATRNASNRQPTAVKTLGLYAQEQVAMLDRLFVTLAVRSDQNSAFGTNFQRVFYPKASVSWLASDESFFPRWSWLNEFRLRTSYGGTGVQPGSTASLSTFSATTVNVAAPQKTSGVDTPGLRASQLGDANLKPETSAEFEAGFDVRFLKNRLNLEATYFNKQTKDALINVPIAPSSAASDLSILTNVGSTKNWGYEAQLSAQLLDTKRVGWDATFTWSTLTNQVVSLGIDPTTGEDRFIGTGQTRQRVGYPINSQWFRPYTYADANHDGIIQTSEVTVDSAFRFFGYAFPRTIASVQTGVSLFSNKLRFNALLDYKGGYGLFDTSTEFVCNNEPFSCREEQDPTSPLWQQARNVAQNYGTVIGGQTFKTQAGYFMDGAYWKFRELSAVVTLPERYASRVRARNLALQLGARNLRWWGKYTGTDPESNQSAGDTQFDFLQASPPTYFTVRLNLQY